MFCQMCDLFLQIWALEGLKGHLILNITLKDIFTDTGTGIWVGEFIGTGTGTGIQEDKSTGNGTGNMNIFEYF